MRGIMRRVYKIGILHELVSRNPVLQVETRSKTDYRAIVITPQQTLATIDNLHRPASPGAGAYLGRQHFRDTRAALERHFVGGR